MAELKGWGAVILERRNGRIAGGPVGGRPLFEILYYGPGEKGTTIVNQGWRLYEARWHKTRFGKPVVNKYARWALVGVFGSEADALDAARKRWHNG